MHINAHAHTHKKVVFCTLMNLVKEMLAMDINARKRESPGGVTVSTLTSQSGDLGSSPSRDDCFAIL